MQAEHQEKQAGSEDGTPASEGAPDLDQTQESLSRTFIRQLQQFLEQPLTVKRATVESRTSIWKSRTQVHRLCLLPPLVRQAMLAQLDAADDPQAGNLKNAQANATKNVPSSFFLQERAFAFVVCK